MSEPRFPEVEERVKWYLARLRELEREAGRPEGSVRLMAVSKTVPPEKVNAALYSGAALVGENRVQELMAKKNQYNCAKSQILDRKHHAVPEFISSSPLLYSHQPCFLQKLVLISF